jgi:acyl dehydratase
MSKVSRVPVSSSTVTIEQGAELPVLLVPPITRTTLALFAGASGDRNPIHIDIDAAHAAGLDDVFAQGMLSMAYLGRMLTNWIPQEQIKSYAVRFTAITPVHGELRCSGRVVLIERIGEEEHATIEVQSTLADGTITLKGTAVVVV